MGKKIIIIFLTLLYLPYSAIAQNDKKAQAQQVYKHRKVMKEIRGYVKNLNYLQADKSFQTAISTYTDAKDDTKLYNIAVEVQRQLALSENKNMYLKNNKADTTKYFGYIYNLYEYSLHCDSLESIPDKKGKVKYKFRDGNARKMMYFRNNLRSAGKYFYRKRDFNKAFQNIDMYMQSRNSAILQAQSDTALQREDIIQMSTLAVLSAYAANDPHNTVKYLDVAMGDSVSNKYVLEVCSKAYAQMGDTTNMLRLLQEGIYRHPEYDYFYLTLIRYYNEKNNYSTALDLTKNMVGKFPENRDYWFIKGTEEVYLNQLDSAIASFDSAILIKADDAESYSSIGNVWLRQAKNYYNGLNASEINKKTRKKLNGFYEKAAENFEQAKKYNENDKELWLSGLRECYFHLNKGKELKSLEKF